MKMPLTKKEAAVIEAYTGVAMLVGDDRKYLYDYLSEVVGIPVYTHEIPHIVDVYKDEVKRDFVEICKSISDADVQEIVRCRDCMYYYKAVECQEYYCGKAIGLVEANFDSFCSYGKKMEGDSNA